MTASASALCEVDFVPEISIGVAVTDNISLAAENEQSETVYELIPAFALTQESTRLSSALDYRAEGYDYVKADDSAVYHIFDGSFTAALDRDNFFIRAGANREQTVRDPEGVIPSGNLPISANRADRDITYLGPSLQYPIGSDTIVRASFIKTWTRYRETDGQAGAPLAYAFNDFDEDNASFSIDNYRRERGVTWATRYSSSKTQYQSEPGTPTYLPYEFRQVALELGAWARGGLRIFVTGGKESAWDMPFDPSLEDSFWEAGLATNAGAKLSGEFAAGERSFGASRRASVDLTMDHTSVRLSYDEEPMTQGRNPYGGDLYGAMPFAADEYDDYLTQLNSPERYLSKRLQWSVNFDLNRTDFTLSAFDESREQRLRLDGTQLSDELQQGATFAVSRRLGARTNLSLTASRFYREFEDSDEYVVTWMSASVDYTLGARTQLALEYSYAEEGNDGLVVRGYKANLVSVLLTRTF